MQNRRNAVFALIVLGGFVTWRNRFAIQRRLESIGVKTPILPGRLNEAARSLVSRVRGRMEQSADLGETLIKRHAA